MYDGDLNQRRTRNSVPPLGCAPSCASCMSCMSCASCAPCASCASTSSAASIVSAVLDGTQSLSQSAKLVQAPVNAFGTHMMRKDPRSGRGGGNDEVLVVLLAHPARVAVGLTLALGAVRAAAAGGRGGCTRPVVLALKGLGGQFGVFVEENAVSRLVSAEDGEACSLLFLTEHTAVVPIGKVELELRRRLRVELAPHSGAVRPA
eukprot:CAMPEP_0181180796 /NCGR_PEP_ID=MMETSP1096-20121128/6991_1 /TAXON_ID=156174 ORGANISM="Chrysochromulina ericina, Strain CCMP281" /NCGR_SAMPLE_ID=MMETSP1096 /ASSEMBLY_ACC=CAM_ASM_000453 /LENGTH=204 /DNA_ID=CAMNT_0023269249 /DNA_START=322 /DNA_END=937 /DNA_ORIENTATION=+